MKEPQSIQEPEFADDEMKMPKSDVESIRTTEPLGNVNRLALLTLLALALFAILTGLVMWFLSMMEARQTETEVLSGVTRPTAEENNEPESTTAEARTQSMNVVSTSDELSVIEADLESTNLDDLDQDLTAVETELNAALEAQ